jgi:small GTP-binding protein
MKKDARANGEGEVAAAPLGLTFRRTLRGHKGAIGRVAWSPDGRLLAAKSSDNVAKVWDAETGEPLFQFKLGPGARSSLSVAWSPDGKTLATPSTDAVQLFDIRDGTALKSLQHSSFITTLAWSPDGEVIAAGIYDNSVRLWSTETGGVVDDLSLPDSAFGLAWSPDGQTLATGSMAVVRCWNAQTGKQVSLEGHTNWVFDLAWSPDGRTLASCSWDRTIIIWDGERLEQTNVLEGHTSRITGLSFSRDGRLLASKSCDHTVKLWRCDVWGLVATLPETADANQFIAGVAFHPRRDMLATLGESDQVIRIWDLDLGALLNEAQAPDIVRYTSAKVVLIGESNVGKSCLALRLAEDRYPRDEEHGTTHGMRFWQMEPERLSPRAAAPEGQRRDVVLWDLGGQDEYRLVHQLFLHDTTLALILLDPTRGQTAFEEVEAWNRRLDKQLGGRRAVKLLVGAKLDEPSDLVDQAALERLRAECGFAGYFETSAKNGRGLPELREAIAAALDWDALAKTSRPELFQRTRDEIDARRERGEVVLLLDDLAEAIREASPDTFEAAAVAAVAEQLATQGVVASTRLSNEERALVLRIEEIERYAGSLIVGARDNAHGVPALEERRIAAPDVPLPGVGEAARLPRLQERVILECVVQLLVEHGVCFRHEGLLIFPSLFRPTEKETGEALPHSVSLYYDFSGAVDNIYASLVARLVISKNFGRVRLWEDRAEFEAAGTGACGVRKVDRGRGFAHLDVYFEARTQAATRELFTSFVEDHLRRHDVEITEHLSMSCPSCGYQFAEGDIRERIARGEADVGCVKCDRRVELAAGAIKARQLNPALKRRTLALRTKVEENVRRAAQAVKQVFRHSDEELQSDGTVRVLHLSDLHLGEGDDVMTHLQPLVADIKDPDGGLGFDRLDYLVISGDITNRAAPREFEVAQQFTSGVIKAFGLNAQRCIVVPGNHDLSWDEEVYNWQPRRRVDAARLKAGTFREAGDGYLLRDEKLYPNRFRNFSQFFYHPLIQLEYPLAFEEQGVPHTFAETGLQFLTFNSAWEIDEWFPGRAGIHPGALARALEKADEQVARQLSAGAPVLRIAVWHHPVTGNEKITDDAFMQQLRQTNVRLVLHGHVHEDRTDVVGYLHPRQVRVAGAGSFGAPTHDRPESTPRLYNLLEIARDHSSIKVHTRCLRKKGGAWEGWPMWPGPKPTEKRTFYTISLTPGR